MKICGIYRIVNLVNGMVYIGRSVDIKKRFSNHLAKLKNNYHNIKKLQADYNKFGEENFKFEILEECEFYDMRKREQYWVNFYKGKLYNSRERVEKLWSFTDEQKEKSFARRSRVNQGENNPRAKLTIEQVGEVIRLVNEGKKQAEIAEMYGVKQGTISKIKNGLRWNVN